MDRQISVKGKYENAKRLTIALWANRIRDCELDEEELIVDYKAKVITTEATLQKKKALAENKEYLNKQIENIKDYLNGEISFDDLKFLKDKFFEECVALTNTGNRYRKPIAKVKEEILNLASRFDKKIYDKIENILKEVE